MATTICSRAVPTARATSSTLDSCHGDLRKGAFLHRLAAYRSRDHDCVATDRGKDSASPTGPKGYKAD